METFHYENPDAAGWFLRHLRDEMVEFHDSCILENLFIGARINECDETVFLKDGDGNVLSLAIIAKNPPAIWSYYTLPDHRGKGCGYRLLVRCIERILESMSDPEAPICMEPTSEGSRKHVAKLPPHLRARLLIRK